MRICISLLSLIATGTCFAQEQFKTATLLEKILISDTSSVLQKMMGNPEKYRIQIIYTEIDRDASNRPSFKNFYFHVNRDFYFYPASTVKLPLALLSLEKLNRMGVKSVNKFTRMAFDSSYSGQQSLERDSTS